MSEFPKAYRILYLGQKKLGENCFSYLHSFKNPAIQIRGVVTNVSNNVWWGSNAINNVCQSEAIAIVPSEKRHYDKIKAVIQAEKINTIISVQYPWILPTDIIESVNIFAFNLHNAKLPEYKGHNTCNHAILNNESTYVSTLHWLAPEVDMGDIIFEEVTSITPDDTAFSLYQKAIKTGEICFRKLVDHLLERKNFPSRRIIGNGTFYPRNSIDDLREIKEWSDIEMVDRKARAFYFPPFEPAYHLRNGKKIYVLPCNPYQPV